MSEFVKLNNGDGSWVELLKQWETETEKLGEDFDIFQMSSLPVLKGLAEGDGERWAGVYGLKSEENGYEAACQLNSAFLPGYEGRVLRVRLMVLSPELEYGDYPIEKYIRTVSELFFGTYTVSCKELQSDHIKFHLRSPADRQFFTNLGIALGEQAIFESVQIRGSWLYITKNKRITGIRLVSTETSA